LHQSDGRPGIVETAQEESADLIVLGRRGTGGLSRWIMGSVAEEVLHQAVCPVLVAH
jgi:nucleotide-binding universal stress UspA family protein